MLNRLVLITVLILVTHCGTKSHPDMAGIGFPSDNNAPVDSGLADPGEPTGLELLDLPASVSITTFDAPMVGVRGIAGQQSTSRDNIPSS